jgi:hypothetical protein
LTRRDPEVPFDLDGEVEFWLEDEKRIITKTSAMFVPGEFTRHDSCRMSRATRMGSRAGHCPHADAAVAGASAETEGDIEGAGPLYLMNENSGMG